MQKRLYSFLTILFFGQEKVFAKRAKDVNSSLSEVRIEWTGRGEFIVIGHKIQKLSLDRREKLSNNVGNFSFPEKVL